MDPKPTLLTFIFGLGILVSTVTCSCPDGFVKHHEKCYMVFGIKANWIDAKKYCEAFGTNLLAIETADEQLYIHGLLSRMSASAFNVGDFWIDGSDLLEEGVWMWVKKMTPFTYTAWTPGNPSNSHSYENCAAIMMSSGSKWNDDNCEKQKNFICEGEFGDIYNQGEIVG